jgi:hypothetical protein
VRGVLEVLFQSAAATSGFAGVFVCLVVLVFKKKTSRVKSLFFVWQNVLVFLQDLPTSRWTESNVAVVLADAYRLKYMFHDAQSHLTAQ